MARIPQIRRHRGTDQVIVYLDGKYCYFGPWKRPESHTKAKHAIAEYLANGGRVAPTKPETITIAQLIDLYQAAGQATDRRDSRALPIVNELYGGSLVPAFTRAALKAVRAVMVERGWTRQDINQCVQRIKKLFRWGEEERYVAAAVVADVNSLKGLERNKHLREGCQVKPVSEIDFRKAVVFLPFPLRAVAELQWLTGARAGEILSLRPKDIERTEAVWVYRPEHHKTMHMNHSRAIHFGPQAQVVLAPFLDRPADRLCFRPRDVRKRNGESYSVSQYGALIKHACKRAGVPHWHSHQLRHAAASRFRSQFGIEAAQVLLGHSNLKTTELYAEKDLQRAAEVAKKAG